jgi:hypothetical protein
LPQALYILLFCFISLLETFGICWGYMMEVLFVEKGFVRAAASRMV